MPGKKFILAVLLSLLPLTAFADTITVAAAANLQFTLNELKAEFTKETGVDVKTVIDSSGKLTAQIENGAPFDVFLSADMKYPQKIYKDKFALEAPQVYALGVLVLWTMKGYNLSTGIYEAADPAVLRVAMADPSLAPYGREAVRALKFCKLYEKVQKKIVLGESIAQTDDFIAAGAADIGFTAGSVVMAPNMVGRGRWIEVNPASYKPIAQGAVILKYGQKHHLQDARSFYEFLFSPYARAIFKKYGYKMP